MIINMKNVYPASKLVGFPLEFILGLDPGTGMTKRGKIIPHCHPREGGDPEKSEK